MLALMGMTGKRRVRPLAFVPLFVCLLQMESFQNLGSPKSVSRKCTLGGIFSHMASFQWIWGVPGQCSHVSRGGTKAYICALCLQSTVAGAGVRGVSFRGCQELKEKPPGNTQQRARPHFLETSSVIPLGHLSQRTGEVRTARVLAGLGLFYHLSAPLPWSHDRLAAFFCSPRFPK